MLYSRRGGLEDSSSSNKDLGEFVEVIITALRDLRAMSKELKYSNWLKMIELKSQGLYDHQQMAEDFKHFGLEA